MASYRALGIDVAKHDVRFVEDNWESPALGAWGLGWEIWLDGMEVTQFTYFQQAGGRPLDTISVEVTYGLERIIMALQGKTHFRDIVFEHGITYGDVFEQNEFEMSRYNLDVADVDTQRSLFDMFETEARQLIQSNLPVPAYNCLLKASHAFNILDARGAVGVTERPRFFQRMRTLSRDVAALWLARREELSFPLLKSVIPAPVPISSGPSLLSIPPLKEKANFLLELGVEELPAADVVVAKQQLHALITDALKEAALEYADLSVDATPRRVVARISGLQTRQTDVSRRVRGPPLRAALKDGTPTKAAEGFLRSNGVVDQRDVQYDSEDGYMYATVHVVGKLASAVLADVLPSFVLPKIAFTKSMRWDDCGTSFVRPIRWLVCLLDDQVVPFTFAGVASGGATRSMRGKDGFSKDVTVESAGLYHDIMTGLQIVLSRADRAKRIKDGAFELAKGVAGIVPKEFLEGDLLEEVTDLVENPMPLLGRFDEEFLVLPDAVLVTVMKKHQRYFPVIDEESGSLINAFITVANGDANAIDVDAVRRGNEAVLRARYSDAVFFYEKDTKGKNLADFVPKLSTLTFQESLGSMLDKVNRVVALTPALGRVLGLSDVDISTASEVSRLYKADLATSMVVEMTSLAGVMGRHYAEIGGDLSKDVSDGIFEACLPRFSGDQVAKLKPASAVAVADRLDSLVGLFSVGLVPKANADPFALRRAALGIVQTVVEGNLDLDFSNAVKLAADNLTKQTGKEIAANVQEAVVQFICRRLEGHLLDGLEIPDDIVKSVLAVPQNGRNAVAAVRLCESVRDFKNEHARMMAQAQEAHCRAARLLKSIKDVSLEDLSSMSIREDLFECDEENALWKALQRREVDGEHNETSNYKLILEGKIKELVLMKECVDSFFDGVFVNAEDVAVRSNRLALCAKIVSVMGGVIDLSLLQMSGSSERT